ncbi:MAG: Hsp20/alpha crystallin family protein [Bacteroidales bacterium]|nr:Hsp20/alpha crystallin family protein [Bacteroidales bacterium]
MLPLMRRNNWVPEVFNDFFDTDFMPRINATAPAINVIETEKDYKVELAAAGMKKEDFNVTINNEGNLSIKMESKKENKEEENKGRYLRREFSYSKFEQTLILPEDVEKEKISAKVADGVLTVTLPKTEVKVIDPTRQITIEE